MIRLYLGRKEQGKTTLAYYMAAKVPRRLIFDPRGLIRRPGAAVARTAAQLAAGVAALGDREISEVVYTPREAFKGIAFPAFAAEVRAWVDESPGAPLAVLVDEISFVSILDGDFEWALKACKAEQIHFFLTCHRPADVPVDVRSIADYWYIFPTTQEHDLEVLRERSPAAAARVEQLRDRQYVCWDDRTSALTLGAPASEWYVDLHRGGTIDLDSSTETA